ncbi:hypothetical protein Rumeso_03582 [Rubellimicrobium mesophilum DSM 19309]|uniref:Uncharacterized protein n=1 Tax=Rubellimicrobium mesophilum DSM 19309 TaxID=442562 RepID=A0A017HK19_9RHOB|nr:hypothetical protein [Rubellimicrobium mesophilum]EYD74852.1 hypothetical protein Rumeso_03582 [Rubellimicrobium mesophilum DSM 19309]
MNPLTWVLAMLAGTAIGGPFLTAAFTLGLYGWTAVLVALALAGFGAAALAQRIEHEIKRQDPDWDEVHDRARPFATMDPRPPEPGSRFDPRRHWRR